MRFSPDFLNEICARVPISAAVGTRITFDRKKTNISRKNFWACCPFHEEKTPSFHCDDSRGRYYCFGCGVGGNHFHFFMKFDGLSFHEAVKRIADMAGMPVPHFNLNSRRNRKVERTTLYDIMELATQFFERLLQEDERGTRARLYLSSRSLTLNLQRMFRLGYAANYGNRLQEFLVERGIDSALLEASGLVIIGNDTAVSYDRFRDRIMFPIEDAYGRIVGFGGRALSSDVQAKYLNSPETDLFHKRNLLYNFSRAKRTSQQSRTAKPLVVVEGYMDVISLTGAGFQKVVAPLGTALSDNQINLLLCSSKLLIFCFDGDDAGRNAAFRVVDRTLPLIKAGVSLSFILLPDGQDPDDVIRERGVKFFRELLGQAIPLGEMLWRRETDGRIFVTPESRAALEKRLYDAVSRIKDRNLRYYYLQDIRERIWTLFHPSFTRLSCKNGEKKHPSRQNMIAREMRFSESLINSQLVKVQENAILPREVSILAILINHPKLWNENFDILATLEFSNQELTDLYCSMLDILAEWHPDNANAMLDRLYKKGKKNISDRIMQFVCNAGMRSAFAIAPLKDARESLKQALCLHQRARHLHKQLREIERELLNDPNNDISATLDDVKNELERTNATEALIEGFGLWNMDCNDESR